MIAFILNHIPESIGIAAIMLGLVILRWPGKRAGYGHDSEARKWL